METKINITLITQTNDDGKKEIFAEYNPDDLEALSLALISTENLREAALLAGAYIIATSVNPQNTANELVLMANDILKENNQKTINC